MRHLYGWNCPHYTAILVAIKATQEARPKKKEDGASSISMMMGIQLNTLVDFHVLTEEQLNGILNQINQA